MVAVFGSECGKHHPSSDVADLTIVLPHASLLLHSYSFLSLQFTLIYAFFTRSSILHLIA